MNPVWIREKDSIVKVKAIGSYKWKIENVEVKGFAPTPFISLSSGALLARRDKQSSWFKIMATQALETREIQGVGANPLISTFSIFHL